MLERPWLLVPVKSLRCGKSRLESALAPAERRRLNEFFLRHMIAVAGQFPGLARTAVVSDADDQSPDSVANYESFFRTLKGDQAGQFVFSGIVTPDNKDQTCPNGESSGDRYMQMAGDTGGSVENICTGDWGTALARISSAVFGPTTRFPLSVHPSDPTQLTVTVNGQTVTTGWHYDAASNAVVFDASAAPAAGSTVTVTYPVGC